MLDASEGRGRGAGDRPILRSQQTLAESLARAVRRPRFTVYLDSDDDDESK